MKSLNKHRVIAIMAFATIALILLAVFYYNSESEKIIKEKHDFLKAVSILQLEQIDAWREERVSDASYFTSLEKIISYSVALNKNKKDKEAIQYFTKTLNQFTKNDYSEHFFITDNNEKILFSSDENINEFNQTRIDEIKNAIQKDSVVIGDFYFGDADSLVLLNIISVIKDKRGVKIGAIVQQVDPHKSLFTLITDWPTPSKTAETLLLKKEKDYVIFLNELRHKKNTSLSFKIHLTKTDLIEVKGIKGSRGIIEGKDYRGEDVLADFREVSGTDWFIVSKVDKNEIYSDLFYRAQTITIILIISVLLIVSVILYSYKVQQSNTYKNLFLKEKELFETQEEYKTTLYSIGDAVITTNDSGRIKHMNLIAEELTGWKESDAKGRSLEEVFNIINEESKLKVQNPVKKVLDEGAIIGLANHTLLISKDGRIIPISDSGSPIRNNDGKIIGVVLVFRDQTVERANEKIILESEQRFRKAFNTSPDSININRMSDGIFASVNSGFLKLTGYSEEEVIGKSSFEINIWADSRDREKLVVGLKEKGTVENLEAQFRLKNGEVKNGLVSAAILELNGEKHILSITRDISERKLTQEIIKNSEANLNSLINNRNESIWSIDKEYNYVVFNKFFSDAYCSSFNIELKKGMNSLEILSPELKDFWKPRYDAVLKGEKISFEFSVIINNQTRYFNVFLNPIVIDKNIMGVTALSLDITDKKLSEKILFENQLRLTSLVNNAPIVFFALDSKGVFTLSEGKSLSALGLRPGQVVGLSVFEVYKEFPEITESIKKALNGESQSIIHDLGKSIFDVTYSPVKNANGETIEVIGVATEITERWLAEKEISGLWNILDGSLNEIFIFDAETFQFEYVNEGAKKNLGYSSERIYTLTPVDIKPKFNRASFRELVAPLLNKQKENIVFETIHLRSNGSTYPAEIHLQLVEKNGKQKFLAIINDITERKKAEEKLKTLSRAIEQSPVSIVITNINGNIEYVNPKFEEVTGYSFDEVKNKNPRVLSSGHKTKYDYQELWQTILGGKEWRGKFYNKKKNGELFWESATISPILNEKNEIIKFIAVKEDITEQNKMTQELIEAKEKAEEMVRLKSYFFANMSHELRTPFVGILGFAEILKDTLENKEEREYAVQILKSSKRLTDTLNKILNISRLEFDKVEVKSSEVDVCRLLKSIESFYSSSAKLNNTTITACAVENNVRVLTDAKLLEDILNNLVNNAIKFTENGTIRLSVSIEQNKENPRVLITVQDTGIGIPKEKQHLIWQEFRQASEGYNRSFEGTGLGLTITKKYVELLGGDISLISEENKGTSFTISLPMSKTDGEIKTEEEIPLIKRSVEKTKTNRKPKLLYVEDDVVALQFISIILKSSYEVETAFKASTALELAGRKHFDILMLDINLGQGMDGVELMHKIREIEYYKSKPIVAVTAYAAESDKKDFLSKGFTHYISKPFVKNQLLDLLVNIN